LDRWLLLLCYADEISGEAEKRVVASIATEGITAQEAARAGLWAFWEVEKSAVELGRPDGIVAGKVQTKAALDIVIDEVWPEDN